MQLVPRTIAIYQYQPRWYERKERKERQGTNTKAHRIKWNLSPQPMQPLTVAPLKSTYLFRVKGTPGLLLAASGRFRTHRLQPGPHQNMARSTGITLHIGTEKPNGRTVGQDGIEWIYTPVVTPIRTHRIFALVDIYIYSRPKAHDTSRPAGRTAVQ